MEVNNKLFNICNFCILWQYNAAALFNHSARFTTQNIFMLTAPWTTLDRFSMKLDFSSTNQSIARIGEASENGQYLLKSDKFLFWKHTLHFSQSKVQQGLKRKPNLFLNSVNLAKHLGLYNVGQKLNYLETNVFFLRIA